MDGRAITLGGEHQPQHNFEYININIYGARLSEILQSSRSIRNILVTPRSLQLIHTYRAPDNKNQRQTPVRRPFFAVVVRPTMYAPNNLPSVIPLTAYRATIVPPTKKHEAHSSIRLSVSANGQARIDRPEVIPSTVPPGRYQETVQNTRVTRKMRTIPMKTKEFRPNH